MLSGEVPPFGSKFREGSVERLVFGWTWVGIRKEEYACCTWGEMRQAAPGVATGQRRDSHLPTPDPPSCVPQVQAVKVACIDAPIPSPTPEPSLLCVP